MRAAACLIALMIVSVSCESSTEARIEGHIVLPEDSVFLERGTGQSIVAKFVAPGGQELGHGPFRFYTENPRIAWVSTAGELHAVGPGTTVLSVSDDDHRVMIPVIVSDTAGATPSYISALPGPMDAWPGDSVNLWGAVRNKWGEPVAADTGVTWTSSNPLAATVNDSGRVRAIAPGKATIIAKLGYSLQSMSITVEDSTPHIEGTTRLIPGATLGIILWAFNHSMRSMQPADAAWTSSDPSVATVTPLGLVTGVANGTTVISTNIAGIALETTITVAALPGTIAYRRNGGNLVSFLALDGSAPVDVDVDPDHVIGSMALSADGSQLAYECGSDVCRYNVANKSRITIAAEASDPSWTADGKTIGVHTLGRFATFSANGGPQLSLTSVPSYVVGPRISPDASGFLYGCNPDDPYDDSTEMCYAEIPTGATTHLGYGFDFAWSPVADTIAFARNVFDWEEYRLLRRLCVSSKATDCSSTQSKMCFADAGLPAWSPDGRYLVFVKDRDLWIASPSADVCMVLPRAAISGNVWQSNPSWGSN
jgi:hypothetical protein